MIVGADWSMSATELVIVMRLRVLAKIQTVKIFQYQTIWDWWFQCLV